MARNGEIQESKQHLQALEASKIRQENALLLQMVQELNEQNERIRANLGIIDGQT